MIAYDGGMHGMLEYCQLNHMTIQAWSPLHKGLFTRNPDDLPEGAEKETSKLLVRLAGKYGVSPGTIMLAWLFRIPCTIQPIIGTTQPDRIRNYKDAYIANKSRGLVPLMDYRQRKFTSIRLK